MKKGCWVLAVAGAVLAAGVAFARAPEVKGSREISEPQWLSQPAAGDFAWAYPKAALKDQINGQVLLDCAVNAVGRLHDCRPDIEIPENRGFGEAARNIAALYRLSPTLADGSPAEGARVKVPMRFDWQGREASPDIAGAPEPSPESSPAAPAGSGMSPDTVGNLRAAAVGTLCFLVVAAGLLIFDRRRRDTSLRKREVLGAGLAFIGRQWRAAPGPVVLVVVANLIAAILDARGASPLHRLLPTIACFFVLTSGLRVAYLAYGRRFALGRAGFNFGEVEGRVWVGGVVSNVALAIGVVAVMIVVAAVTVPYKMHGAPDSQLALITGVIVGLLAPFVVAAGLRGTLLQPFSAAHNDLDIAGAWVAGRGRLGLLAAILLLPLLALFAVGVLIALVPQGMWPLSGLIAGVAEAAYYAFVAGALAQVTLHVSPPRTPLDAASSPLGVVL